MITQPIRVVVAWDGHVWQDVNAIVQIEDRAELLADAGGYRPRRLSLEVDLGAAVELVARVGRVDLDDGNVRGGAMSGWWAGANWWATRRWKASVGYGNIDLDKKGVTGNTKTWLSRIQWIY